MGHEGSGNSGGAEAFLAIPDHDRFHELIEGALVRKASPSGAHSDARGAIIAQVRSGFHRPDAPDAPGGWWIYPEPEVRLGPETIVRPDIAGWRRSTCPTRPIQTLIDARPDWVCEVISESNANHDTVRKLRLYHSVGVPFYWLVDPRDETLSVLRWSPDGYVSRLSAERSETVKPEPFEALELRLGLLFGDDP